MRKAEINEIKEIKERNDEVCVGNTRLVKVFSYRLTLSALNNPLVTYISLEAHLNYYNQLLVALQPL